MPLIEQYRLRTHPGHGAKGHVPASPRDGAGGVDAEVAHVGRGRFKESGYAVEEDRATGVDEARHLDQTIVAVLQEPEHRKAAHQGYESGPSAGLGVVAFRWRVRYAALT